MSKKDNISQDFDGEGLTPGEKRKGTRRFKAYKERYNIDNISDLELLSELVFREILQIRTKVQIGEFSNSVTTSDKPKIPTAFLRTLDENLQNIITLKKELGLLKEDKEKSFFDYIKQLKAKFKIWREKNQGSRQIPCPFCKKIFYLMIRTDKYKAVKPGCFKDRILGNKTLWEVYKNKEVLTKEKFAESLGSSEDYVDWLEEKIYSKE